MSRIFAILLLFLAFLLTSEVKAVDIPIGDCLAPMRTEPPVLYSDPATTGSAKFIVDLSGVANVNNSQDWEMEFECGINFWFVGNYNKGKATPVQGSNVEIYRDMQNIGTGCEFSAQPHTIKVWNGSTPICRAHYLIENSDNQCELTLNPETGITFNTDNLTVSGKKLTSNGQFKLFFDNIQIENPNSRGFLPTPAFPDIPIDKKYLTPTSHKISIRRYNLAGYGFGSPLCPISFTVGSPDNPGSVVKDINKKGGNAGPPATSSGQLVKGCNDPTDPGYNPRNPAIATAIGCIHTNPVEFAKDLMRFVIGIAGGLAFLMMLIGAFQMMTSGGNPDTLRAGRERLTSAVIGLLFVIFAVLLLQIIGVQILSIPGFK